MKKIVTDTENIPQIKVMIVSTITEIKLAEKKKIDTKNVDTVTKRRGDTNLPEGNTTNLKPSFFFPITFLKKS